MSLQSVHEQIAVRPLRALQVRTIALGLLVNMLDGLDLLAASLVAPVLTRQWNLQPEALGALLSAGPLGTFVGALLLSPVADLRGRRTAILVNLALMSVGMLLSARASSILELAVLRFITGMGVGAMAGCVGTLVFEYTSRRTRNLALGLVVVGYNSGVVLGGLVSLWIIHAFGWQSIFLLGGVLSLLMIGVVHFLLPESIDQLVSRPRRGSLAELNRVMKGLGLPAFDALPAPPPAAASQRLTDLLRRPILPRLLLMQLAYLLYMLSSYFFLNWNNQLTTQAGFSDAGGLSISILTNLGGIAGGVLIGALTLRLAFRPVATATLVGMGLAIAAFGFAASSFAFTVASSVLAGFGIFGTAVVIYATGTATFPAHVRATGMGLSMTAGRIGSVIGPYAAGLLLGGGAGRLWTCLILAVPVMLSAIALSRVPLRSLPGER